MSGLSSNKVIYRDSGFCIFFLHIIFKICRKLISISLFVLIKKIAKIVFDTIHRNV